MSRPIPKTAQVPLAVPAEVGPDVREGSRRSEGAPSAPHSDSRHRVFRFLWYATSLLLAASIVLLIYSAAWEYSTRRYLKGFSDAIVPTSQSPENKIEAILRWMASGPARLDADPQGISPGRDPIETLNYQSLLQVCGSATNAFINLADSSGLAARRVLLLDSRRMAKHVVAEVLVDRRWIVVDPAFRTILRGADGKPLTARQLADPVVFAAATRHILHYDPDYSYESTSHVRLARLRVVGLLLRKFLDRLAPGWENSPTLSLLVERESLATLVLAIFLLVFFTLARVGLRLYGEKRFGFHPVRFRRQVRRACSAFLNTAS